MTTDKAIRRQAAVAQVRALLGKNASTEAIKAAMEDILRIDTGG